MAVVAMAARVLLVGLDILSWVSILAGIGIGS